MSEHGVNLDNKKIKGENPLNYAIYSYKPLDIIEKLLILGYKLDNDNNNNNEKSLLYNIVKNSYFISKDNYRSELIELLYKYNVQFYKDSNELIELLIYTIKNYHFFSLNIIELLIKDAIKLKKIDKLNRINLFSIIASCFSSSPKDKGILIIDLLSRYGIAVSQVNKAGQTPLIYAIENNKPLKIIKSLINKSCNLDIVDNFGDTAIFKALKEIDSSTKIYKILNCLLTYGAKLDIKDKDGNTPLILAIENNLSKTIIKCLINKKIINEVDKKGETALLKMLKPFGNYTEEETYNIIKLFIENGANLNIQDLSGRTPLIYAIEKMLSLRIIELLICNGSQIDISDKKGETALFKALKTTFINNNQYLIIDLLLKNGANYYQQNNEGDYPLIYAIKNNSNLKSIKLLIEKSGALTEDYYYKLCKLLSKLFIEKDKKNLKEICYYLLKYGLDINKLKQISNNKLLGFSQFFDYLEKQKNKIDYTCALLLTKGLKNGYLLYHQISRGFSKDIYQDEFVDIVKELEKNGILILDDEPNDYIANKSNKMLYEQKINIIIYELIQKGLKQGNLLYKDIIRLFSVCFNSEFTKIIFNKLVNNNINFINDKNNTLIKYFTLFDFYLREINKFKSLSIQEENNLRNIYLQNNRIKNNFFYANLKLVVSIAIRFKNQGLSILDLIQEGNIGLFNAINEFNWFCRNSFSNYATLCIIESITNAITYQAKTIRLPINVKERINLLQIINNKYRLLYGRKPNDEELSKEASIPTDNLQELKVLSKKVISLEKLVKVENVSSEKLFKSKIHIPSYNIDDKIIEKTDTDLLIKNLSEKEAKVIKHRLGLYDNYSKSLDETGKALGLTRERIRQIETKALEKLRKLISSQKN